MNNLMLETNFNSYCFCISENLKIKVVEPYARYPHKFESTYSHNVWILYGFPKLTLIFLLKTNYLMLKPKFLTTLLCILETPKHENFIII